jgi:hypothetical protein
MRRSLTIAIAALLVAASPAVAAAPFYGVMWDGAVTAAPAADQDAQFALMAATGVGSVRTVFSWSDAQPAADAPPSFAATDALMARAASNRLDVLPVVMYAPPWARQDPDVAASPPARDDDYTAYLRALIGRYGPAGSFWTEHPELPKLPVGAWQIWNEPQLPYQWAARDWEQGYGRLLQAAYATARQADPGARVVLGAATNFAWDALESLYTKGGVKGRFDVAALHPYTGSAARVVKAVKLFRDVLRRHGDGRKPVWITELAWPASRGKVKPPAGLKQLPTTDRGMADRLARAYRLLRNKRTVARAYWYTWASSYAGDSIFAYTGLLRYDGRTFRAKPGLRAYRNTTGTRSRH